MSSNDQLFSERERRFATIATGVILVIAVYAFVAGGLFNPPLGSAASRKTVDLPGILEATPALIQQSDSAPSAQTFDHHSRVKRITHVP